MCSSLATEAHGVAWSQPSPAPPRPAPPRPAALPVNPHALCSLPAELRICLQGAAVAFLLRNGVDPAWADDDRCTALHRAAYRGDASAMHALVTARANVDAQDGFGCTPLSRAASHGTLSAVLVLVSARARVDLADFSGFTPLAHALARDADPIARRLCEAGACRRSALRLVHERWYSRKVTMGGGRAHRVLDAQPAGAAPSEGAEPSPPADTAPSAPGEARRTVLLSRTPPSAQHDVADRGEARRVKEPLLVGLHRMLLSRASVLGNDWHRLFRSLDLNHDRRLSLLELTTLCRNAFDVRSNDYTDQDICDALLAIQALDDNHEADSAGRSATEPSLRSEALSRFVSLSAAEVQARCKSPRSQRHVQDAKAARIKALQRKASSRHKERCSAIRRQGEIPE